MPRGRVLALGVDLYVKDGLRANVHRGTRPAAGVTNAHYKRKEKLTAHSRTRARTPWAFAQLTSVEFETTQLALAEFESNPLDISGKVSPGRGSAFCVIPWLRPPTQ